MEKDVVELKTMYKSLKGDIEDLKEQVREHNNFSVEIAILGENIKVLTNEVRSLQKSMDDLVRKPVKQYDNIKMYVTTTIISALIGFLFNYLLK